jgi:hypothetical protein
MQCKNVANAGDEMWISANLFEAGYNSRRDFSVLRRKKLIVMPLFMDTHNHIPGLTADAIKKAHAKDLEVQSKYGVEYLKYWFDEGSGKAFCLVNAPNKEAAEAVHREAHGLVADSIVEVQEGA